MRKSNVAAAANANKQSADHGAKGDEHSEDDDDDDAGSEGATAPPPSTSSNSNRNSLTINNTSGGMKSPTLFQAMDTDKTPTTNSLLSQAQSAQRSNGFQAPASIRRHGQLAAAGADQLAVGSSTLSPPQANNTAPFIGAAPVRSVRELPHFPDIEEALGVDSTSPHGNAARQVWRWFEEHLNALLDNVRSFRFDQFELNLRSFWSNLSGDHREVVHAPAVAGLMARADALVYNVSFVFSVSEYNARSKFFLIVIVLEQEILEILRLQMLSAIPPQALNSLRQLADKMEKILLLALENYGNTFVEPKVELGARFGHLVCESGVFYTSSAGNLIVFR